MSGFPSYDELERPDDGGLPLVRGVWGSGDQLGTLNNVTPEKAAAAARLVSSGRRFNLDLELHLPFEGLSKKVHALRHAPNHTAFAHDLPDLLVRDDKVDELFLQGSSQWDGLTHVGDAKHGFYNGVTPSQVTQAPGTRNGIDNFAKFCLFTRAVLADLPPFFAHAGRKWSVMGSLSVSAEELQACLAWQGCSLEPGDVLLVRTGWLTEFLQAGTERREHLFADRDYSGLTGEEDMWRFIWDNRLAAVGADNVGVERWPRIPGRPSLHLAIARLGLNLGELLDLDELAEASAASKRYASLFVAKPLNLRGGVGSPANAMAVW